jgi:hypothetical protein
LRSLLESLDLGLDDDGPLRVLLLCLVQRSLRRVDRLLTAFTLLLPCGLFIRPFKLAAPPFPFVVESRLSLRSLVDGARERPLRLWAFRLAGGNSISFCPAAALRAFLTGLSRLPLRFGRQLLCRGLLGRFLPGK